MTGKCPCCGETLTLDFNGRIPAHRAGGAQVNLPVPKYGIGELVNVHLDTGFIYCFRVVSRRYRDWDLEPEGWEYSEKPATWWHRNFGRKWYPENSIIPMNELVRVVVP